MLWTERQSHWFYSMEYWIKLVTHKSFNLELGPHWLHRSKIWKGKFHFLVKDGDRIEPGGRGNISQGALFKSTVMMCWQTPETFYVHHSFLKTRVIILSSVFHLRISRVLKGRNNDQKPETYPQKMESKTRHPKKTCSFSPQLSLNLYNNVIFYRIGPWTLGSNLSKSCNIYKKTL